MIYELLTLRDPQNPRKRLPLPIHKLIPNPLASYEQWIRFYHLDICDMSADARACEAWAIRDAIAHSMDRTPPEWLLDRLQRLEAS